MHDLIQGLNQEQATAVKSNAERILMLAGAGTGKTRTLTHRLAHLNLNCRVGISGIVAITFTRAAAKEMKDRLIPLIGEDAKKLACCTFHALAVRILQEWGHRIGLDKQFTIYSQEDRDEVLKAIISQLGYRTSSNKVIQAAGELLTPGSEEARIWQEYEWQLKRFNAVDLDALIVMVNRLFEEHEDIVQHYRKQWKYVFVDEFQDTDGQQLHFIKLLRPENLFVIGDDFQAIYGWRGARVQNILEFPQEFPGTEVIKLEQNYRSTKEIIDAANNLISHNMNQTKKRLYAHKDGAKIDVLTYSDDQAELDMVVSAISNKDLISQNEGRDYSYSDFAVLARTNAQIERMYWKLRENNIPCMILSSSDDPLKKQDVKSLLSYLNAIFNPKDETNFKRAILFPDPAMTPLQRQVLEQIAIDRSITLREAMKHSDEVRIKEFSVWFEQQATEIEYLQDACDAFTDLAHGLGLDERYRERKLTNRMADLKEAAAYIRKWVERQREMGEDYSPTAFLKWLKIRDIQEKLMEEQDAVKLMTIHGSKGLEFDTVFLVGMNQDLFPSKNTRDMEEERRLAYVAVTRAKNRLVITTTRSYASSWGKTVEGCVPSCFIAELRAAVTA